MCRHLAAMMRMAAADGKPDDGQSKVRREVVCVE